MSVEVLNNLNSQNSRKREMEIREISRLHKETSRLNLSPKWQRKIVWTERDMSLLIQSCLYNYLVPPIFLKTSYTDADEIEHYDVIDGKQRLTAILDFIDNKYHLKGLDSNNPYQGQKIYYRDFNTREKEKLMGFTFNAVIVSEDVSDHTLGVIFKSLNSTGKKLLPAEVINCTYMGTLIDRIHEICENNKVYKDIYKGDGNRFKPNYLALVFFMLHNKYPNVIPKEHIQISKLIEEFCRDNRNAENSFLDKLEDAFSKSIKITRNVFGNNAFRTSNKTSRINSIVFYAITYSFLRHPENHIMRSKDSINELFFNLLSDDQLFAHWTRGTKISTISTYLDEWNKGLNEIFSPYSKESGKRYFSFKLKEQMFEKDPTCSICGNRIEDIKDAAMDHHEQYWKGGLTIPDNSRLAHMFCNNRRSKHE